MCLSFYSKKGPATPPPRLIGTKKFTETNFVSGFVLQIWWTCRLQHTNAKRHFRPKITIEWAVKDVRWLAYNSQRHLGSQITMKQSVNVARLQLHIAEGTWSQIILKRLVIMVNFF